MASAEVSLELLGSSELRSGKEVAARVRVRALEPLKCEGVDLGVGCRAVGDNCDGFEKLVHENKGEAVELFPGGEYERTIQVRLPGGPISYRGHYFNIEWFVRAEVRLPWRFDLREEREFVLLPRLAQPGTAPARMESSPPVGAPVVGPAVAATPTVNRGRRALKLFLAAFLLTAVGAGFIVYLNVTQGPGKDLHGVEAILGLVAVLSMTLALLLFFVPVSTPSTPLPAG
jgi:hypothetical protein